MDPVQIHCSNCNFKVFSNSPEVNELVEVKKADPPLRANGTSQEIFNRGKFFKCPKCGHMMKGFFPPKTDKPQEQTAPPDFPKDMDERINGGKMGEDFLKQVDRYMKQRQAAEKKRKS